MITFHALSWNAKLSFFPEEKIGRACQRFPCVGLSNINIVEDLETKLVYIRFSSKHSYKTTRAITRMPVSEDWSGLEESYQSSLKGSDN